MRTFSSNSAKSPSFSITASGCISPELCDAILASIVSFAALSRLQALSSRNFCGASTSRIRPSGLSPHGLLQYTADSRTTVFSATPDRVGGDNLVIPGRPGSPQISDLWGVPDRESPLIVTTARVDSRKNVHGYIRALAILRDEGLGFRAKWYGLKEENAYYRRCRRLIRHFGLDGIFEILPATKDVVTVYHSADCFCLPSFYEGTPNSLCEALSCGLPAVATRVSDNATYIRDGLNGYTCATSPRSIAAALRQLLLALRPDSNAAPDKTEDTVQTAGRDQSKPSAAAMRNASRQTALSLLSKPVFISNWLSVL